MEENQSNAITFPLEGTSGPFADFPLYTAGDTIPAKQTDIQGIFGTEAQLLPHSSHSLQSPEAVGSFEEEVVLYSSAIVLFLFYCLMVRRYGYIIPVLFKSVFYKRSSMKLKDSLDVNISDMLTLGTLLFLLCLSVIVYTALGNMGGFDHSPLLALWFIPGMLVALGGVCLFRALFHVTAGWLGNKKTFLHEIRFYNKIRFTFWSVWLTPLVLLCCFTPPHLFQYTIYIILFSLVILLIQHIIELYQLFIREKISFLQYILYFCTVELLPVSFLIVYTLREWAAF